MIHRVFFEDGAEALGVAEGLLSAGYRVIFHFSRRVWLWDVIAWKSA